MKAFTKNQQMALDRAQMTLGNQAFYKLGSTIRRALVADQLLRQLAEQDEDGVSDAKVRKLLINDYNWLILESEEED